MSRTRINRSARLHEVIVLARMRAINDLLQLLQRQRIRSSIALTNFLGIAEDQQTPADGHEIANLQNTHRRGDAVDPRAVRALQIRENHLAGVFLNFQMEAADSLIIELHAVVLFSADGEWRFKFRKYAASLHAFEDLKSHLCHVTSSSAQSDHQRPVFRRSLLSA